jgi:hypothetical protein
MNFCIIRLGKDSVEEIEIINSQGFAPDRGIVITIRCKQVPAEVLPKTFCFIWLGSDNNKGLPTKWEQGLRAFGYVVTKRGGPAYNDEWELNLNISVIYPRSIKQIDIIGSSGAGFIQVSNIPVVGINTHSNQTVQLIRTDEVNQNVVALFYLLNKIYLTLIDETITKHPAIREILSVPSTISNVSNNLGHRDLVDDPDVVTLENRPFDEEEQLGSSTIIHPFDPTKIDIRPQPLTILSILKRLSSEPMRIDLNTEFQRKGDLWELENQSKLIESLLVRIPLPAFYFDGTTDRWLIVDGLQRISALRNFILLKKFKLTGLEYLKNFENHGWDDLPTYLQTRIEETHITAYIINPGTPEEVKFNIFKRINTGGLILTPQEIRHALNQGVPAKFVADLAKEEGFIRALGGHVPTNRMEDRDYVTRFLGFYISEEQYKPDLDSFLNNAMARVKAMNEVQRAAVKHDFIKSMNAAVRIFGEHAFRKRYGYPGEYRKPVNKALYECLSVILSKLNQSEIDLLVKKKESLNNGLIDLINNNKEFLKAISSGTGDIKSVERRYSSIRNLFKNVLDDQDATT